MCHTIVLDGHTLGVVYPNCLQVLRASVSRGAPFADVDLLWFDPVLMAGRYRNAVEADFEAFRVVFHPDYLLPS